MSALEFIAVVVACVLIGALVLAAVVGLVMAVTHIADGFGVMTGAVFFVNVLALFLICKSFRLRYYEGRLWLRILKYVGSIFGTFVLLAVANAVLYLAGYLISWVFGLGLLSVGTNVFIGLVLLAIVVAIVAVCYYIKDYGWAKALNSFFRILGILLVVGLIGCLIWWIF